MLLVFDTHTREATMTADKSAYIRCVRTQFVSEIVIAKKSAVVASDMSLDILLL